MWFLFVIIFIFSNFADKSNRIWIFEEFKGAITEQYVLQELNTIPHLQSNYYWTSQSKAEVDFLISEGLNVIPLECKAGYTMNAKSLKSYGEKYSPTMSLRTSLLPYERNEGVCNIPLYILFAINNEIRTTEEFHFLSWLEIKKNASRHSNSEWSGREYFFELYFFNTLIPFLMTSPFVWASRFLPSRS